MPHVTAHQPAQSAPLQPTYQSTKCLQPQPLLMSRFPASSRMGPGTGNVVW